MADFPASPATVGQAESRAAFNAILHKPGPKPAWWQEYLAIREMFPHFRNWRIWVYIAWCGQPASTRDPATEEELAKNILGCTSRAIRGWKAQKWPDEPDIADAVAWVQASPLLRARREIYEALVTVATMPDPKAHNDRRLALEMLGDYRPKGESDPGQTERARMEKWIEELKEAA